MPDLYPYPTTGNFDPSITCRNSSTDSYISKIYRG
jgi:hypothetical protein